MSANIEEICQILYECNLYDKSYERGYCMIENNSIEDVKKNIEKLLANIQCNIGSVEYANLNKMLAICYLKVLPICYYCTIIKNINHVCYL